MRTLLQDGAGRKGRSNTSQECQAAVTGTMSKGNDRNPLDNLAHKPATTRTTYSPEHGGKPMRNIFQANGEKVGTQMKKTGQKRMGRR